MRALRTALTILVLFQLGGCLSTPEIRYITSPKEDYSGLVKFYLSSTSLILSGAVPSASQAVGRDGLTTNHQVTFASDVEIGIRLEDQVKLTLVPREHRGTLYGAVPVSSWLGALRTHLKATYFDTADTSHLLKSIGSSVQDDRMKIVSAIGAAAGSVPFIPPFDNQRKVIILKLPIVLDSYIAKKGEWLPLPRNSGWFYKFETSSDLGAAVRTLDYFTKYSEQGSSTATFPTAACRRATLHIKYDIDGRKPDLQADGDGKFGVLFADPDYVDTLQLPEHGSLNFHAICGADVVAERTETHTAWDVIEAVMNQVKTIEGRNR